MWNDQTPISYGAHLPDSGRSRYDLISGWALASCPVFAGWYEDLDTAIIFEGGTTPPPIFNRPIHSAAMPAGHELFPPNT